MWENAYLSIKNPKASRALKRALDPATNCSLRSHNSALLCRQLSASAPGAPLDQILDPHLCTPNPRLPTEVACQFKLRLKNAECLPNNVL